MKYVWNIHLLMIAAERLALRKLASRIIVMGKDSLGPRLLVQDYWIKVISTAMNAAHYSIK